MKKFLIVFSLITVSLTGIYAMNHSIGTDKRKDDGMNMKSLWKNYEEANKADKPQKEIEILDEIKALAKQQGLPWDFYHAGELRILAGSRQNWKERERLIGSFKEEVASFKSTILSYYFGTHFEYNVSGPWDFLEKNRKELKSSAHRDFYTNDHHILSLNFGSLIAELIADDFEYILWDSYINGYDKEGTLRGMLEDVIGDSYPKRALLDFIPVDGIRDDDEAVKACKDFVEKYGSKAAALLARQKLLRIEKNGLDRKKGSSDEYLELRERCREFEKDRKAFNADEKKLAAICTAAEGILKELESKDVEADIREDVLTIQTRNLNKVDISLTRNGRKTFSRTLDNPKRSFYAMDTLVLTLPKMDDGKYMLSVQDGSAECEREYHRFTLSAAHRKDAEGYAIFVTDASSGQPVGQVDMKLSRSGKELAEAKGVTLDGFTYLPESIASKINSDRSGLILTCTYNDEDGVFRSTDELRIYGQSSYDGGEYDIILGSIFTDRTAFNPGETVQFKAILYHGGRKNSTALKEGEQVTVTLVDQTGKTVSEQKLKTNEFGSVAGSFKLPESGRNGICTIQLHYGKDYVSDTYIRVDDFVLPTFELEWDTDTELRFHGEELNVSGRIQSYSGHSLSGADIKYSITKNGDVVKSGSLSIDGKGRFSIPFQTENIPWVIYRINVKVTDATGETLEWNTTRSTFRDIPFNVRITNEAEGTMSLKDKHDYKPYEEYNYCMVSDNVLKAHFSLGNGGTSLKRSSMDISYELKQGDRLISKGKATPGQDIEWNLEDIPSGMITLTAKAMESEFSTPAAVRVFDILLVRDSDKVLDANVENVFRTVEDERSIGVQIGSTSGETWVSLELFGNGNRLLGRKLIHLKGERTAEGSLETVLFPISDEWSDIVSLNAIYFRNYSRHQFIHQFDRSERTKELPLEFTRFEDRTAPGSKYIFEIKTKPGVECTASIFDKSTETIMSSRWSRLHFFGTDAADVYYTVNSGDNSTRIIGLYDSSTKGKARVMMSAGAPMVMEESVADMEESLPFLMAKNADEAESEESAQEPAIRENFANTIAFEPFLRSDDEGKISLEFATADKLSTYYVQLFAHDKEMNNATLRREMQVTIPVKVSVVEPQFLYTGDKYVLKASVSSNMEENVNGTIGVEWYNGTDYRSQSPFKTERRNIKVTAMGNAAEEFSIDVPDLVNLGVKISFSAADTDYGSDAVWVTVPVFPPLQTATEAHSAILHPGENEDALIESLKALFVNTDANNAIIRRMQMRDMILDAIPSKAEPESDNVLDLSEALYIRMMARSLGVSVSTDLSDEELTSKIMECMNADGGFAWFKGWESSPVITATMLERIASIRHHQLDGALSTSLCSASAIEKAVKYLDRTFFSDISRPFWCGSISEEEYFSLRARFAEVEFSPSSKSAKSLKGFRKNVQDYLLPESARGLNGFVLQKARRAMVLYTLTQSRDGIRLAKDWGIRTFTAKKLARSCKADLESLLEYAVDHKSGGMYYPNAVMPFRGLLESEAYAHAFICGLLTDTADFMEEKCTEAYRIADGIRLWLMVQKESQDWAADASFVEALATVMDASDEILNTSVISLSKSFCKEFSEITASGNGFTVTREFFRETIKDDEKIWVGLNPGDALYVGDKIKAEYHVWNEENRSFVKITAPRMASMRPVEQLSGNIGWWLRPLYVSGWHSISPNGYRNVTIGRSEYWFDVFPEENTSLSEEFFITQKGFFLMPAMEVESLYAPHYRAIGDGSKAVESK